MMTGLKNTNNLSPAAYIQICLTHNFGPADPISICIFLSLFAFTILIGNYYYVNSTLPFITKRKRTSKWFNTVIHLLASLFILIGAGLESQTAWGIADILIGFMCIINIPVILYLSKYAFRTIDNYIRQKKKGLDSTFKFENVKKQDGLLGRLNIFC